MGIEFNPFEISFQKGISPSNGIHTHQHQHVLSSFASGAASKPQQAVQQGSIPQQLSDEARTRPKDAYQPQSQDLKPLTSDIASEDGSTGSTVGTGTNTPSRRRSSSKSTVDSDSKRAEFLARNRLAATKCRERKKQWLTQLEQRSKELASRNAELVSLASQLRDECKSLRRILLENKGCDCHLKVKGLQQAQYSLQTQQQPQLQSQSQSTQQKPVMIGQYGQQPVVPRVSPNVHTQDTNAIRMLYANWNGLNLGNV